MSPRRAAAQKDGQSLYDLLVEAAEKLIATRGTADLTVREIARTAGVADGVLYNHFSDKEELVARALNRHVRTAETLLGELPVAGEGTLADNLHRHLEYGLGLHRMIVPVFSGLHGNPQILQRFTDIGERPGYWRDRLLAYLREEQALGRIHPESDVDATAVLLVGYCHETVLGTIFPHASRTNPPEPAAVIRTVLNGIAPSHP
ncbi:TetR/AcrR family transcriptional regulator [Amycolatopsis solani]|uniref:TetR/AcrR family transcriptional regulator n=1 Tax=Amycolatopsis solani TaxID=3028615 RepID=UPI0025B22CDF|nr:TetR/AcrR family transcriptional regulator [Amycolatopsis sp. MEP2-6]